jgi:hypothetical protein
MIRHIVSWKIKDGAEGKTKAENLNLMKEMLLGLKTLPMLKNIEVGINSPKADQNNFDIVLDTLFENMDDLNAYQLHPDHKAVAAYIGKIRDERACVDFEC